MFQMSFLNEYDYFKWVNLLFYEVITGCSNNQDILVHIHSQNEIFLSKNTTYFPSQSNYIILNILEKTPKKYF